MAYLISLSSELHQDVQILLNIRHFIIHGPTSFNVTQWVDICLYIIAFGCILCFSRQWICQRNVLLSHYLSFSILIFEENSFWNSFATTISISQGYVFLHVWVSYQIWVWKSSCKSFVKLLSPIGGCDRHISCSKSSVPPPSYSHAMVGDGLMLLGKLFRDIFRLVILVNILSHVTLKDILSYLLPPVLSVHL